MTQLPRVALPGLAAPVSAICLGGAVFGARLSERQSFALLDAYAAAGGNFVDTASVYCDWIPDLERSCSEKIIGRWKTARPQIQMVFATKGGHHHMSTPHHNRLSATEVRDDLMRSLDNLGLDCVPLYYLHRDAPDRPVGEVLSGIATFLADGLIEAFGLSNWSAPRLALAMAWCRSNGVPVPIANQCEWSLAKPNFDSRPSDQTAMTDAMLAFHRETNMAALPYSSQAKGFFDKCAAGTMDADLIGSFESPENTERMRDVLALAQATGARPIQVALNILMRAPFTTVPVVGCPSLDRLADTLNAATLTLPPCAALRRLEARCFGANLTDPE